MSLAPGAVAVIGAGSADCHIGARLQAICGAVVRLAQAQAQGVQAPRNAIMVELLSAAKPAVIGGRALRTLLGV